MDTKEGKPRGAGGGGVMNWAIGIDMYTLMCIKLMTNKNLLYKEKKEEEEERLKFLRSVGLYFPASLDNFQPLLLQILFSTLPSLLVIQLHMY